MPFSLRQLIFLETEKELFKGNSLNWMTPMVLDGALPIYMSNAIMAQLSEKSCI